MCGVKRRKQKGLTFTNTRPVAFGPILLSYPSSQLLLSLQSDRSQHVAAKRHAAQPLWSGTCDWLGGKFEIILIVLLLFFCTHLIIRTFIITHSLGIVYMGKKGQASAMGSKRNCARTANARRRAAHVIHARTRTGASGRPIGRRIARTLAPTRCADGTSMRLIREVRDWYPRRVIVAALFCCYWSLWVGVEVVALNAF